MRQSYIFPKILTDARSVLVSGSSAFCQFVAILHWNDDTHGHRQVAVNARDGTEIGLSTF